jgi:hypothetical protein
MDDDERIGRRSPFGSQKSYSFLLSLSKKLGTVATSSFVEVRAFLRQDVPLPSGERFFNSLKRRPNAWRQDTGRTRARRARKPELQLDPNAKLQKVLEQSHEILASANTVFPITLFPDTVFVDRTKVTIIRRNFFWSEDVMSIRIQDVLNVSASVGPLFGSLTLVSRVMSTVDHFQINYFWRSDATHLKHIIQGYVIAQHNKLDIAHLTKDELITTLQELGHDSNIPYR